MKETEEWAYWGQGGFNPEDERVYRKTGKNKNKALEAAPES
jgi:tRNA wybutosine-synthesizing protein 1